MPLFERSFSDLVGDMVLDLTSDTRITRVSPGSKARAILEIVSRNLNQAYKIFDLNFARAFLSGASGKYLDLLGEILGVPRLGTQLAQASATSAIQKFFVQSGTFGDINNGTSIAIPAGTIVSSQSDANGITYKLTTGIILSSAASEQFVDVQAISPGEASNVGSEILQFHNFTNYTDIANDTLKCINIAGIFNGADIEIDPNYRFRISRSALASEAANQTSILLAALSVPGVANVLMQNRATGIGTFKVLIKSVTPSVQQNLIDQVQANIDQVTAEGIRGIADKPNETGMSFNISLSYRNGIGDDEKLSIDQQVEQAITDYVNNLDIGEEFIVNELVQRVLTVSPNIKDMGQPNKPVDQLFLYKETKLRDNKIRQQLFDNYTPTLVERIIIEPTVPNPIVITRI